MTLAVLLELVLIAFVLGVAAQRLQKLAQLMIHDPEELGAWAKRRGTEGLRALAEELGKSPAFERDPVARLAVALAEPDPRLRTASCNEALLDLEAGLGGGDEGALVRLCVFGTLLCAALVVLGGESVGLGVLDVLSLGGGALLVVLAVKREGRRVEVAWRQGVDRWVEQGLGAWGQAPAKVDRRRRGV